jgi:hypothetical protein
MFTTEFPGGNAVRSGASIKCTINGIEYTATIHRDDDSGRPGDNDEGFWPSLDRSAPGWIGDNPPKPYEQQMAECEAVIARWKAGKMVYCGIVLSARKAHASLIPAYECALWGLDINWPHGDNGHLLETANELLRDAVLTAEAALAKAIESARKGLALLEAA